MSKTISAAATGLPTRRTAMLASLAGLGAAVSLPKAVKAAVGEPATDPIFAAIEKHRAAWAAFEAADRKGHRILDIPDDIVADSTDASEIEEQARFDMHETVPQTMAGLAAYIAYWHEFTKPPEGKEYGQLEDIGWEAIPTIAEAMATLFPIGGAA